MTEPTEWRLNSMMGKIKKGAKVSGGDTLYLINTWYGGCEAVPIDAGGDWTTEGVNLYFWDKETAEECAEKINSILSQY